MEELPKVAVKATRINPRRLVIYSPPKMGKTTLVSKLDNCLILDLEQGSQFIDALKIEINDLGHLRRVIDQIKAEGKPYKYIAVDTVTKLESMVLPLALKMYMDTPMGKGFKGDDVRKLPNGAGYLYLREAFETVIEHIDSAAGEGVILIGHLKDKMLGKNGTEVVAKDINLTGQNRNIICSNADAIGYLFRDKGNTILNFASAEDVLCGSRMDHLRGRQIILGEEKDGVIVTHWDRIFIPQ